MKRKLIFMLTMLGIITSSIFVKAQVVCDSAKLLTQSAVCNYYHQSVPAGNTEYWYKFVAGNSDVNVSTLQIGLPVTQAHIELYGYIGNCNSLTKLGQNSETLNMTGLTFGATYYVRVFQYNMIDFDICIKSTPSAPCTAANLVQIYPTNNNTLISDSTANTECWYKFDGDTAFYYFKLEAVPGKSFNIQKIYLFSGTCTNLQLIDSSDYNDSLQIFTNLLETGKTYFIKIVNTGTQMTCFNFSFGLNLNNLVNLWHYSDCPRPNCNWIRNGDFEILDNLIFSIPLGQNYHSPFSPPFDGGEDDVCGWRRAFGTPQISTASLNHYAVMWSHFYELPNPNTKAEAIITDLGAGGITNGTYTLDFDYKCWNQPLGDFVFALTDSPFFTPPNDNAIVIPTFTQNIICTVPNPLNDNQWYHNSTPFSITSTYHYLIIYPRQTVKPTPNLEGWLGVDDISIIATQPIVSITSSPTNTICIGQSATLTASGALNYVWSPGAGLSGTTGAVVSAHPTTTTTYTVSGTNVIGCDGTSQITVTVNTPVPDFTWTSVCNNFNFTGTSTCFSSVVSWSWNFGDITPQANIQNPTHYFNQNGGSSIVTLTIVDLNGVSHQITHTVNLNSSPPAPIISGENNNCSNNTIVYTITNAIPAYNYIWNISPVFSTNVTFNGNHSIATVTWDPAVLIPGTHTVITVTYTDNHGCTISSTLNIFGCCEREGVTNYINNSAIPALPYPAASTIVVNGTITVPDNTNRTFNNCFLYMGPESKIVVGNNATLTIDNMSWLKQACDWMWDGIYVTGSTSHVLMQNNSIVEDAINGVVSSNNGDFKIYNSTFQNNYIGVTVKDYHPFPTPFPNPSPVHQGKIYGTTFTNTAPNHVLQYQPHVGQKTKCGVDVKLVQNLTIGDPAHGINTFSNMNYGVYATDAYMKIYNNYFDNIIGSFMIPSGWAIYDKRNSNNPSNLAVSALLTVGGTGSNINTFTGCNQGVYAERLAATILNNTMSNIYNGIYCFEPKSTTTITGNTITHTSSIPYASRIGIRVQSSFVAVHGLKLNISSNTINSPITGIWLTNDNSDPHPPYNNQVNVNNNHVSFAGSSYNSRYGIRIEKCDNIKVNGNDIVKSSPSNSGEITKMRGISVSSSAGGWITNNSPITNMGSGIRGVGDLTNTQFSCNFLDKCYNGIYFDIGVTSISDQGNAGRASDNNWLDGGYSGIPYRLTGGIINAIPMKNWYFRGMHPATNNYSPFINLTNPVFYLIHEEPNINVISVCSNWIGDDVNDAVAKRARKFAAIANNQIQYTNLATEFTQYNREYLFDEFDNDTTLLNLGAPDDADYLNMYNQLKNDNIGSFVKVRKLLDTADYETALTEVDAINPQHLIHQNRKTVMKIYLQSFAKDKELDSAQTAQLMDIALMTPYVGGDAVFSARVMLGIDPDDYGVSYRLIESDNQQVAGDIKIFPNPAKDNITIAFPEDYYLQDAEIKLYGILGNLIFSSKLINNISEISIERINQGIYYYIIIVNNNSIAKDKLIIIK